MPIQKKPKNAASTPDRRYVPMASLLTPCVAAAVAAVVVPALTPAPPVGVMKNTLVIVDPPIPEAEIPPPLAPVAIALVDTAVSVLGGIGFGPPKLADGTSRVVGRVSVEREGGIGRGWVTVGVSSAEDSEE